jgi:predicted permease
MSALSPYTPWLTTDSFSKMDGIIFLGCCAFITLFFSIMKNFFETDKARAWIVTLLGSFVLTIVGTSYCVDCTMKHGLIWTTEYIHGEDQVTRVTILFFVGINVMDIVLGMMFYPKFLDPLSAYFHHIVYTIFAFCLLAHHYARGLTLCFFMEPPTFLLALGSLFPSLRNDLLFGILFFITRIAYNIYFILTLYNVAPEGLIWRICSATLCLHLFWFYKWSIGYMKKKGAKTVKAQ